MSVFAAQAYAGAWTQEKGNGLLIATGSFYSSGELINNSGHRQSQPVFSKYEFSPYFEYGLYDGTTIGANLSLLDHTHSDALPGGKAQSDWGVGDSEFFLRQRLWQANGFVASIEPMIKLPSPYASGPTAPLGSSHPDIGLGFSGGYGFSAFGQNHFADIDTQYRHRFGNPRDQVRLNATLGIGVTHELMVMPQAFMTRRVTSPQVATFSQSPADDYNLTRLQLSAVYKLDDKSSVQLGAFHDVAGRNVGIGNGALVAVWRTF